MDSEQYMFLMDRLDDLFDAVSQHDWSVPQWMRVELRDVKGQYDRINAALEVDKDVTI
jgi:hypothetical protein